MTQRAATPSSETSPDATEVSQDRLPRVLKGRTIEEHQLFINEAQLLLSQKRTSLAILRTGLGIMTLPASVFTVLVATSRFYDLATALYVLAPLAALCISLVGFGTYLIMKSLRRIWKLDHLLQQLESRDSLLKELIAD